MERDCEAVAATDDVQASVRAAFSVPETDGSLGGELGSLAKRLAARRRSVVLAFAPKAAGTFFRTAAIAATDGKLVRTVHAQGERDAQFYLPAFLSYYLGRLTDQTLVTHVHMQALTANQRFIEAFDLKPIVMVRPIPDMLASYFDMLEHDPAARAEGLNFRITPAFPDMSHEDKTDFLVDMLGPWYASYFATWLDYGGGAPERVHLMTYDAFRADPAGALQAALAHSGIFLAPETCRAAIEVSWPQRHSMRFNQGIAGRGRRYFTDAQFARLARMLSYYGLDGGAHELLLGP